MNFYKTLLTLLIAALFFLGLKYVLPKDTLTVAESTPNKNIAIDSLALKEMQRYQDSLFVIKIDSIKMDSIHKMHVVYKKDSLKKAQQNKHQFKKVPNIALSKYKTDLQLEQFYKQLEKLEANKNTKVRIAYYGDSMNDGDLIVQDLRKLFQEKYGGKGVGFVNIYSESARNRGTVKHNFSNDWTRGSFLKRLDSVDLGISGYVAITDSLTNSWVSYKAGYFPSKNLLYNPTLYYGKSDSASVYIDEKGLKTEILLEGHDLVNTNKFSSEALSSLKLFFNTNRTPIYGIDFSTNSGIHIDNFSTRGNSGLGLTALRYRLMAQFQKKLNYDLIILQFGTNVVSYKNKSYSWYKRGMKRVVKHLNNTFTKADVLVFSVADKSRKYDLEMKTDSAVYKLLKSQYYLAKETNSGFLNLYELMGGNNSMVTWVEEEPIRARQDYTHFNSSGSKAIAKLIFKTMEQGFEKYKRNQTKQSKKTIKKETKKDSIHD